MIRYPFLKKGSTIGVTAPSSGVPSEFHVQMKAACKRMEKEGFSVICGETVWTQDKAKSSLAKKRAEEFNEMMHRGDIDLIIPPWGGELLIETLQYIDIENMKAKWVLGYSDTSLLMLAITLTTGIATAHGTNMFDLRGEYFDETTEMWKSVLSTENGESILQHSSKKYQKEWQMDHSGPYVFNLTEPTNWKSITGKKINMQGRLLGGCIDIIRHLAGTPYGDIKRFQENHLKKEPILWFFENCDLNTTDLRRSLVQMQLAGWFDHCSGIVFGRSDANTPVENYTVEDVYRELSEELHIPVIYDIDCGHVPPQITFINGAWAELETENGKGTVLQYFI
ncbi:LD-carboxypeptidase family protein [Bacillus freudenreichii]|nr:LD-carboxypeptidase family protein [Bacillus freudenreichii]